MHRVPLAWRNLTHEPRRLALAVGGVGFAVVLMFLQRGFQHALFDSQARLIDELDPRVGLVIVSRARYALPVQKRFARRRLRQAAAAPEVDQAAPLYLETRFALLRRRDGHAHPIRVLGLSLDDPVLARDQLLPLADALRPPWTAAIDRRSKRAVFPMARAEPAALARARCQLADRPLRLVGALELGTDFTAEGTLAMSDANFARYFPNRNRGGDPLELVDVGAVRLRPGADPEAAAARLQRLLPDDVLVLTRQAFRRRETAFWDESTPIGVVFATGAALGFLVGMVICYQTMHTDISDHLAEYATLKAMGYGRGYFVKLILAESVYLCALGFVPALLVSWGLFRVLAETTGLWMRMTPWTRPATVFLLTLAMCAASGLLALRKLAAADPADLF